MTDLAVVSVLSSSVEGILELNCLAVEIRGLVYS
jgi:hypothetical protein